ERVGTRAALDHVVVVVAPERVAKRTAAQVLDTGIGIACCIAGVVARRHQIDRQARRRGLIAGDIVARAAIERIGTRATYENVVAATTLENVAPGAPGCVVL